MTYEGGLYALFQDTETRGVYYRADWLEEAGLEAPENGWTFEDMREMAAALTCPR
jgi:multiple sugar transport system substrate-binding protein